MEKNDEGKPWFLAVNLVNPHDTMFFNTDREGEKVQADPTPIMKILPAQKSTLYDRVWDIKLSPTLHQELDEPGRPPAHTEFVEGMSALVGDIPDEDEWRYTKLMEYYFNCISHSDKVRASPGRHTCARLGV